ncbi:MAG: DNA polymerase III subunit gamma/tau [Gammaproteobacteria bacterium]|jgi:DNA polymerase-3 subunit gamma/tau|nr:DNA polymerase III subunit gamma/tau [Gammaproteobacteria bacterium]MBT5052464.1 DNA polymerase III subunit gamma/tau [Gammaproteobacteria bacterium]
MSYQVLARKYRPGHFKAMEGQGHVLQALINALDQNRLHHAYLFTGTRGVGKTTIARIFAKCLNCEQGVTSEPCGTCSSCVEISEGRSVDLIEVDAASRTGVDDMRDLLDNVQYLPTASRFKVYLIDEVHMLSKSSFNAMLKTLEEPPEHVKFLFATTDPKKLPVTVLSRCLQFNLKNMTPERVVNHLKVVLAEESIEAEDSALWQLGRAADGSMRDALSLTDQAIAFGSGKLLGVEVATMLGTVDRQEVYRLIDAVAAGNGAKVYEVIDQVAEFAPDFSALLDEVLTVLHKVAVFQVVPEGVDNSFGDREKIGQLATNISAEQVQLFYQIALMGKRDLNLAPDLKMGFEMTMIRMLAFELDDDSPPEATVAVPKPPAADSSTPKPAMGSPLAGLRDALTSVQKPQAAQLTPAVAVAAEAVTIMSSDATAAATRQAPSPEGNDPAISSLDRSPAVSKQSPSASGAVGSQINPGTDKLPVSQQGVASESVGQPQDEVSEVGAVDDAAIQKPSNVIDLPTDAVAAQAVRPAEPGQPGRDDRWRALLTQTNLGGIAYAMASNCVLTDEAEGNFHLSLDPAHSSLFNEGQIPRLSELLGNVLGRETSVFVTIALVEGKTPAALIDAARAAALEAAEQEVTTDPGVQHLIAGFDAKIVEGSVMPKVAKGEG